MSELADICEAIINVSHGGKPRGLSPVNASRLRTMVTRARDGETESLDSEAPELLRLIADYWWDRRWLNRLSDLEHEVGAARLAARLTVEELRGELARLETDGQVNAEAHRKGIERMGTGTRPTAAAVAGEASAHSWEHKRLVKRAIEIHQEGRADE